MSGNMYRYVHQHMLPVICKEHKTLHVLAHSRAHFVRMCIAAGALLRAGMHACGCARTHSVRISFSVHSIFGSRCTHSCKHMQMYTHMRSHAHASACTDCPPM